MFLCQNKCVYKTNCLKEVQMRLSNKHITHRKRIKTKRIGIEMNLCTSYDCFYTTAVVLMCGEKIVKVYSTLNQKSL